MKLKRILALVLAATCVFGMLAVGTGAEDGEENLSREFYSALDTYLRCAEELNGYFAEDSFVGSELIKRYFCNDVKKLYPEYNTDGKGHLYEIPADKFEELVFGVYAKTDAAITALHSFDIYNADGDASYYSIDFDAVFGNDAPFLEFCGYTERADGMYEAWAYAADHSWLETDENGELGTVWYTASEEDVEGVDYLMLPQRVYDFDNPGYIEGYTYAPAKIFHAVKSVIEYDGDGVRLRSFEKIATADLPAKDKLITDEIGQTVEVNNGTVYLEVDKDTFAEGTSFYIGVPNVYDNPGSVITSDECKIFREFIFSAIKDGEEVQPQKTVTLRFTLPGRLNMTDAQLYSGDLLGECELIASEKDGELVASVDDFSKTYSIVGTSAILGDSDGDGNINIGDVSRTLMYIAKWDVKCIGSNADVNADGNVNLSDVTMLLRYIANWYNVLLGSAE